MLTCMLCVGWICDVGRGEFIAIIGPSGSGKSTLFNILGGLAPPTEGRVIIDGEDIERLTDTQRTEMRQRKVGFVFQKYNLLPTLDCARQYRHRKIPCEEHGRASAEFRQHS